jgi:hypothetical protein
VSILSLTVVDCLKNLERNIENENKYHPANGSGKD